MKHSLRFKISLNKLKKALLPVLGTMLFLFLNTANASELLVLCKNQKNVRTLRIDILSDGRCRAIYTKQGVDQIIGTSQNRPDCDEFIAGVRKKIEEVSWTCREVKDSRVSTVQSGNTL